MSSDQPHQSEVVAQTGDTISGDANIIHERSDGNGATFIAPNNEPRSYAGIVKTGLLWNEELEQEEEEDIEKEEEQQLGYTQKIDEKGVMNFVLSEPFKHRAWRQWRQMLVVKMTGKKISYDYMKKRLHGMWEREGRIVVTDVHNGFFLVRFKKKGDLDTVRKGGPWVIQDHYLYVADWTPAFEPREEVIGKTKVWVRLPDFPTAYVKTPLLSGVGNWIGTYDKMDVAATMLARGKFIRISVVVDLNAPLILDYSIDGRSKDVEYEGLPLVCQGCKWYGHAVYNCPKNVKAIQGGRKKKEGALQEWIPVTRKNNKGLEGPEEDVSVDNQFMVLQDEEATVEDNAVVTGLPLA